MKAEVTDTAEGKQTRKKAYVPDDDKDYRLCCIRIEDAENGVVVNCSYELKPDVKDKMNKGGGSMGYYGDESEKHVFDDYDKAKTFIAGELDQLWAGKGDGDGDESGDEE